jgi:hypothetical protein
MARIASRTSGTAVLRPRARVLRTLGDQLISSEKVAVIELVKNAFDADATRVLVRFHAPLGIGDGSVEVIDNGHGMSLKTIEEAWMEPATLFRKRRTVSERLGRRVLGEKGIGRFAASRLADCLEVVTRRSAMNHEIKVFFDWTQFDDENKYLDQVAAYWERVEPSEICLGGTIQALWQGSEKPGARELSHGTISKTFIPAWPGSSHLPFSKILSRAATNSESVSTCPLHLRTCLVPSNRRKH